jgi:hypothetical protein
LANHQPIKLGNSTLPQHSLIKPGGFHCALTLIKFLRLNSSIVKSAFDLIMRKKIF